MLYNVMEEMAREIFLDMISHDFQGCTCEICQNDILAIALNRLPPQYSSSTTGELYVKARLFASQWRVDIVRELTYAIGIVATTRKH
nr:late competence development ComFB family protein [Bacilli bacterium]